MWIENFNTSETKEIQSQGQENIVLDESFLLEQKDELDGLRADIDMTRFLDKEFSYMKMQNDERIIDQDALKNEFEPNEGVYEFVG